MYRVSQRQKVLKVALNVSLASYCVSEMYFKGFADNDNLLLSRKLGQKFKCTAVLSLNFEVILLRRIVTRNEYCLLSIR